MRTRSPLSSDGLGVVVPTLNEATYLPALLGDLSELSFPAQVVVSDGGSTDATRRLARERGAEVILARRGRAHQMNAGARVLSTGWLLFLHADSRLPARARECLADRLSDNGERNAAYFRFAVEGQGWFFRCIELGQFLRERIGRLPYGDQGLLVRREDFEAVGAFPEIPILEDVAILRALQAHGPVRRLPAHLPTSARRYKEEGRGRTLLRNLAVLGMTLTGARPERLASLHPARGATSPAGRIALLFAKAPRPGKVKTRLAAAIGARAAADLYRSMASDTVERLRSPGYDVVVCYDPPTAASEIRAWLGEDLALMPQAAGDLGHRMDWALGAALEVASAACVVGTDVPDLTARVVEEAFEGLENADLVIGPAEDGGYYLLALKRPIPELFQGMPWSTPDVLGRTLAAAQRLGLRVGTLETLRDVDTPADLRLRLGTPSAAPSPRTQRPGS